MPRIEIERKHTYQHYQHNLVGNQRVETVTEPTANFHSFTPYYPVEGTGESNRVGRKIQLQHIHDEGFLRLPIATAEGTEAQFTRDTIIDAWNGYMQSLVRGLEPDNYEFPVDKCMFSIPVRHMWIEFQDDDFYAGTAADKATYLASFFKNLWISTGSVNTWLPSVQTTMLRESTPYTGRFRVVKDTTYWLSPEKPMVHYNEDFPYKRTANFEAQGSDPTNVHLFSVWIGPIQPVTDYFNSSFGSWMTSTTLNPSAVPYICATYCGNIKLTYIDV